MGYEPKLIAPFDNSGLKKWYKPWLIGNEAFPIINDAYARRGVVRKREGFRLLATLPISPAQGLKNWVNPQTLGERLIGFSTTKSYLFDDPTQSFVDVTFDPSGAPFSWNNGSNDYFWTSNYAGSMWTTNNLTADNIKYWNVTNNWTTFQPFVNSTDTLDAALIIIPFYNRLIALNVSQNGTRYQNRATWSRIGTPYVLNDATHVPAPGFTVDADAWRTDIPGKGGFADADTSESIVSAAVIKNTLIVFFQRSTWRLRPTGNQVNPFIFERVNTQYGSESPYSTVSFDEAAVSFSRYGWIAANTNDVARIDLDIPDDSFAFEGISTGLSGLNKVQAIRDYFRNFAYFTYIPIGQTTTTQIYAYNYIDRNWSIFNPQTGSSGIGISTPLTINCFGSYRNTSGDWTWARLNAVDDTWENFNSPNDTWQNYGAAQNIDFPSTLGGDLSGNVYLMFEFFPAPTTDNNVNFPFSVFTKRFNPYIDQGLKCRLGYVDLYCTSLPGGEITVNHYVDDQQVPVFTRKVEIFSRGVINITAITPGATTSITTSGDHGLSVGEFVTISNVIGSIGKVLNNETLQVQTTPTTNSFTVNFNTNTYAYVSGGYIYNANLVQGDAHYTRIYLGAIAHMHQLEFTMSNEQVIDPVKGVAQFEMQGLVIWTRACGKIRG